MEAETCQDAAGVSDYGSRFAGVLDGAVRGAVGAMTMTGMRVLTTELGLVKQTPPGRQPPTRAPCCGGRRAGSSGG